MEKLNDNGIIVIPIRDGDSEDLSIIEKYY